MEIKVRLTGRGWSNPGSIHDAKVIGIEMDGIEYDIKTHPNLQIEFVTESPFDSIASSIQRLAKVEVTFK